MNSGKKAAIDLEEIQSKSLSDITAADFLAALNAGGISAQHLTVWPEKKKVELWREPENFGEIRVRDVLSVIRNEKKKVELEKLPGFETWRDPREFVYDDLLTRLTRDIETRLRVGR
jgi:hypothetical protein